MPLTTSLNFYFTIGLDLIKKSGKIYKTYCDFEIFGYWNKLKNNKDHQIECPITYELTLLNMNRN